MKSVLAHCGLVLAVAAAPFVLVNATNAASTDKPKPIVLAQAQPAATPDLKTIERDAFGLPLAPGHDVTIAKCSGCHDASTFSGLGHTSKEWGDVIDSMISRGADVSAADFKTIQTYLATYLPAGGQ